MSRAAGDMRVRMAMGVNVAADPRILGTIGMEGVSAAVWQRSTAEPFQRWIDSLPVERLPRLRATVAADVVDRAVLAACERSGTPAGRARDTLAEDAGALARRFAEALRVPFLRVRVDVVEGDSCRKWHLDRVRARLLCTWRGPGTEYGAARPDGQPLHVHRLETGWAAVFRGFLWRGTDFPGVVHRSPPLEGAGTARLLLVLDPAEEDAAC